MSILLQPCMSTNYGFVTLQNYVFLCKVNENVYSLMPYMSIYFTVFEIVFPV